MTLTVIYSIFGAFIANVLFTIVAYGSACRDNGDITYFTAVMGGIIAAYSWAALVLKMPQDQMFITNLIWDVGVTIMFVFLPFIMYDIKVDIKTMIGAIIAVIGIIIAKI
jgi:uncharacterized membrane protein